MNSDIITQEIEAAELSIESLRAQINVLQSFIAIKTAERQGVSWMSGAEARLMMHGESYQPAPVKRERWEGVA